MFGLVLQTFPVPIGMRSSLTFRAASGTLRSRCALYCGLIPVEVVIGYVGNEKGSAFSLEERCLEGRRHLRPVEAVRRQYRHV